MRSSETEKAASISTVTPAVAADNGAYDALFAFAVS